MDSFGSRASKIFLQGLRYEGYSICHRAMALDHAIPALAPRARFLSDFPRRIGGKPAVV